MLELGYDFVESLSLLSPGQRLKRIPGSLSNWAKVGQEWSGDRLTANGIAWVVEGSNQIQASRIGGYMSTCVFKLSFN